LHRIDNATAATVMPTRKALGTYGFFTQGNPSTGVPATIVEADILNATMMEIANVVTLAGITLSKTDDQQLWEAINALINAARLGFTPVEQGGGIGQGTNKVHIGWDGAGLKAQVDALDLGEIGFIGRSNTWTAQQQFNAALTASGSPNSITANSGNIYAAAGQVVGHAGVIAETGNVTASAGQVVGQTGVQALAGNVTANGGRLRASYGAFGSSDQNAAVLLLDYLGSLGGNGYLRLPNGLYLQWGYYQVPCDDTLRAMSYPIAFPQSAPIGIVGSYAAVNPNTGGDNIIDVGPLGVNVISGNGAQFYTRNRASTASNPSVFVIALGQ
jgi:hypothetical protein